MTNCTWTVHQLKLKWRFVWQVTKYVGKFWGYTSWVNVINRTNTWMFQHSENNDLSKKIVLNDTQSRNQITGDPSSLTTVIYYNVEGDSGHSACGGVMLQWFEFTKVCMGEIFYGGISVLSLMVLTFCENMYSTWFWHSSAPWFSRRLSQNFNGNRNNLKNSKCVRSSFYHQFPVWCFHFVKIVRDFLIRR